VPLSGWDAAALFAKAATYAATLAAAGCVFFLAYSEDLLQNADCTRIRRLIGVSLAASAMASAATFLLLGMFDATLTGMLLRGGEGRASGIRMAGVALAAFAVFPRRSYRAPAIIGAIAAATSFAWVGHVHALRPNTLPALLLCLHLLCAAFWLGALAPLLLVARHGSGARIGLITARFGAAALRLVAVLVVAGATLLWIMISDAAKFWGSDYGRLLATKLVAVILLLSIAAMNKLYLTPRLLLGDAAAAAALRRSIKAEMVLGGLVLLITAAFTTITGPPH
jgi:putative copper resistance protein D